MGNNNVCFYRHSGSLPFPCHLQLGRHATINLTTSAFDKWDDGSYADKGEVSYTVEGSTCNLALIRIVDRTSHVNHVSLLLYDSIACLDSERLCMNISKTLTGFITTEYNSKYHNSIPWTKTKKKVDARGGVTDTKIYLYGTANRCGLLIWEHKKNDSDEDAKALTIAHYFVHSSGTVAVNRCESSDVGFSVVVNIAESDGKFDITVEGPERHPVSALLYMFHEVNRSGIWKPSMCPHCGNVRRNMSSSQSDREESDGRQRNAVRINNGGRFNGHANGSSITCTNFYASYKGKP
ncbi:hypothetical protein ACSQ67_009442 [Phaseolus vulgaris]